MEQHIVSSLPAEVASTANGTTEIVPNSHEHEPVSEINFDAHGLLTFCGSAALVSSTVG